MDPYRTPFTIVHESRHNQDSIFPVSTHTHGCFSSPAGRHARYTPWTNRQRSCLRDKTSTTPRDHINSTVRSYHALHQNPNRPFLHLEKWLTHTRFPEPTERMEQYTKTDSWRRKLAQAAPGRPKGHRATNAVHNKIVKTDYRYY